jgi:hypothetical protein
VFVEMVDSNGATTSQGMKIRAYGVSASSVRKSIEEISGVNPKKKAVLTTETGKVWADSEAHGGGGVGYCDCGSPGGDCGEGIVVVLIIMAVLMVTFAAVWTVVMIAFSIITVGGFLKRRYRTVVIIEKMNREFLGKLSISIARNGGVLDYSFGHEGYDDWVRRDFKLHIRLKHLRQISLFFGIGWGLIEAMLKLNEILLGYITNYGPSVMPLRLAMIAIFIPLLIYSLVLEGQFRNASDDGEEMVIRLLSEEYSFSPDHSMAFGAEPRIVPKLSAAEIRKMKY